MNRKNKRKGDFYASKVRLFLNEYVGIDLEKFRKALSVLANIRNHKLKAMSYPLNVSHQIKITTEEERVNLLPYNWRPAPLPLSV